MSLGRPDLYIAGQLMQTGKADTRPALAGASFRWGNDSRLDQDPPATLSAQILIIGAMPDFLNVGAAVGLNDPETARCLFAGTIQTLKAAPDDRRADALRVTFTAASPLAELIKHPVFDFDWPNNEIASTRFVRLATSMPRGWALTGQQGLGWVHQGRQKYQSIEWIKLAERFANSYTYRYHDTSYHTPGSGVFKRITFTPERPKTITEATIDPGTDGVWWQGTGMPGSSTGMAVLPASVVHRGIEWEKTPDDTVTDVKVTSWGAATAEPESGEYDYDMNRLVNNQALQDAYGFRQITIETALSAYNGPAVDARVAEIANYWLEADTEWRPTGLQLPDSRKVDTAAQLNLLAVDTRHMASISVPDAAAAPGRIRSFVIAGAATWTGKKWITDLTLGRTL